MDKSSFAPTTMRSLATAFTAGILLSSASTRCGYAQMRDFFCMAEPCATCSPTTQPTVDDPRSLFGVRKTLRPISSGTQSVSATSTGDTGATKRAADTISGGDPQEEASSSLTDEPQGTFQRRRPIATWVSQFRKRVARMRLRFLLRRERATHTRVQRLQESVASTPPQP